MSRLVSDDDFVLGDGSGLGDDPDLGGDSDPIDYYWPQGFAVLADPVDVSFE